MTRSGAMVSGKVIAGVVKQALLREVKISSHPSIKRANSAPVRYNKNIRKNAESMGTPIWLQRDLVAEQAVSKCNRLGAPLAHKGQEVFSAVA